MKFNYQARTKKGDIQTGIVEASSREAAAVLLQKHKFFVTLLEESGTRPFYTKRIKLFEKISRKDIVTFSRQLSIMFKSDVPLIEGLQVLASQDKSPNFREKILTLLEDVRGGTSFSQALSRYPKLFSPFYISMIKSGEASGTLSDSLTYIAEHLERDYNLYSKIKGAMVYPALIVFVVVTVLVLMMVFVIANLTMVLKETGQELPFFTKVVIFLSDFLKKWILILFVVFVGLAIFIYRYFKTQAGKRFLDRALLNLPLIGPFLKMVYISRFAENLSTLIAGGLSIVQALEITKSIVDNDVYQKILDKAIDGVKRGEQISSVLIQHPKYFPPVFTQMVMVGEKTGTLDRTLASVVIFNQKELDHRVDALFSILEPLLIVGFGLLVAGLMGSILMPLYKMSSI